MQINRNKEEAEEQAVPALRAKESKGKKRWIVLILLLLAILIGVGAWFLTRPKMDDTTQYWFDKAAQGGSLAGKTPQELQGMLDKIMEDGMVNVAVNAVVIFEDGTSEGSLGVENSAENQYYMRVLLTKDDDGTVLYESKGIKPGQYIDKIKLNKALPAGEYACTATEIMTDPDSLEDIGKVNVKVTVLVKN